MTHISLRLKWLKRSARQVLLRARYGPQSTSAKKIQVWSIGIWCGPSLLSLSPATQIQNPVLTRDTILDVDAEFVADPFMLKEGRRWHMFFEVYNRSRNRGEIGLASSKDALKWTYDGLVLIEPFHLSYPYVFRWQDEHYMIPESYQDGSIRLYRAERFPDRWKLAGTLLRGRGFADSSIFRFDNRWWLFTETNPDIKHDTLRLYWAEDLLGPWHEHPRSPLIEGDPHVARPAGRVLVMGHQIFRFAQDCHPVYGTQVRAFEVVELTPTTYREQDFGQTILAGTGTAASWNADGMHHLDAHCLDAASWIACVDGFRWS